MNSSVYRLKEVKPPQKLVIIMVDGVLRWFISQRPAVRPIVSKPMIMAARALKGQDSKASRLGRCGIS
jgi:hypothetical protein